MILNKRQWSIFDGLFFPPSRGASWLMSLNSGGLKKERIDNRGRMVDVRIFVGSFPQLEISIFNCRTACVTLGKLRSCHVSVLLRELLNSLPCQRLMWPHLTPQDSGDLCLACPFVSWLCNLPLPDATFLFKPQDKCTHPEDVRLCTMIVKSNGSFPVNKKKVVSTSLFF